MNYQKTNDYELFCDVERSTYTRLPNSFNNFLFGEYIEEWLMTQQERMAIINLLDRIRPECSVELGTLYGGSLSAISRFSKKVYTLDIDASCRDNLKDKFKNVEFIVGNTRETLPVLLKKLQQEKSPIEFVLIDASHETKGIKKDIENVIQYVPEKPLFIVIHDSFMPNCRKGILEADWNSSPYVHLVEVDFIPGRFNSDSAHKSYRKMTCGLAIAMMLPLKRKGQLNILVDGELPYNLLKKESIHQESFINKTLTRVKWKIKSLL